MKAHTGLDLHTPPPSPSRSMVRAATLQWKKETRGEERSSERLPERGVWAHVSGCWQLVPAERLHPPSAAVDSAPC